VSKENMYRDKGYSYYSGVRWDIIDLIPEGPNRVLEVGCGTGNTLIKLKEIHKAQEIYGLEMNREVLQEHIKDIDKVIIGDVERIEPPFPEGFFDYIVFADVLEHLIEPEEVLNKYMKYLKTDGGIIASIPNIRHNAVLFDLVVRGRFEYRDAGILDRSHLRFFTKKEIIHMFERTGMHITEMRSNLSFPMNIMDKVLNALISKHKIPGYSFFTIQYIIHAKKTST